MATLQRIRNAGPVIVIVIGIALVAFLLGDVNQLFSSSGNQNVAEINGQSVSLPEYQARYKNYEEGFKLLTGDQTVNDENQNYIKSQVWEKIIKDYALNNTYDELGIMVSDLELAKIVSGENIQNGLDPLTRQVFSDPNTGQFNIQAAVNFFTNAGQSPETQQIAIFLEEEMRLNRQYTKYSQLILKGINVTTFEAKSLYRERTEFVDFNYTVKKYTEIPDSSITVNEKEMKAWYDAHKDEYKQEESRDLAYVVFDIISSEDDKDVAKRELEYYKTEFASLDIKNEKEIAAWVNANSQVPYFYAHLSLEQLGDTALYNSSTNEVFGPVYKDGFYVMKRLISRGSFPDTVEARHILIRPDGQIIKDLDRAKQIADSLKTLLKNGADFAELAKTNSADGSAQNGGDLGKFVEGQMVQEFSDACFNGKPGDIVVVESQFGVHIINITWQSKERKTKVRVAEVYTQVRPGNNTISEYYSKSRDFSLKADNNIEKFDKLTEEQKLTKRIATSITPETEVIAGIQNPGTVINWSYGEEIEKGSVSQPFQDGDMFIVAIVTEIREKGIAQYDQIKEEIKKTLIKNKKGELLAKQMKSITDPGTEAKNISFSSSRINMEGFEPIVIATATLLEKDKLSEPLIGENGVYVIKVTSKTAAGDLSTVDLTNDKLNAERGLMFRMSREVFEALKEVSEVTDNRFKFFGN
jgi:peptidyl-prolyl cis-trans isomerase D